MTEEQFSEWVICGRLPRHQNGKVDLFAIERAMRDEHSARRRVGLLKRILEARRNG